MTTETPPAPTSSAIVWIGRVISTLPLLMLIMSGVMKFVQPPGFDENIRKLGWPIESMYTLGIIELTCVVLYALPYTSVLGAIMLTGYLGGAIATHMRINDPFIPSILVPILLGVMIWLGLFLRDARLRALIPWKSTSRAGSISDGNSVTVGYASSSSTAIKKGTP